MKLNNNTAGTTSTDAAAWRVASFNGIQNVSYQLDDNDISALERAVAGALSEGRHYQTTTKVDFDLGSFEEKLRQFICEVEHGRGFVLLRGLPVQRHGKDWGRMAAWAIGTHFGRPVSQTRSGTMMADVMDVTKGQSGPRGYNSSAELRLHTDPASDLVALCCLETAKSGGESIIASAISVHDEIAKRRPDLLQTLLTGFFYHRLEEGPLGADPISERRVPIFIEHGSQVLCRYGRQRIRLAHEELGIGLSDQEQEALAFFNEVANDKQFSLHFKLEPGDFLIANNLATLHARTNFEDNDDPNRPRHLLRLWIASEHPPEVTRDLNFLNDGACGIPVRDAA